MKKILILLFSIFLLSSTSVFADDISDFEIEGMSIGDSLLDYMTEDEILEEIELYDGYQYLNEPFKYTEIYSKKDFQTYTNVSFFINNNSTSKYISNKNEKFTILGIRGLINYIEDFDSCLAKKDEIVSELSKMSPNADKWGGVFEHAADPSGNSIVDAVYFEFGSGAETEVSCYNFEETFRSKINWAEGLEISIDSEEIAIWMRDY